MNGDVTAKGSSTGVGRDIGSPRSLFARNVKIPDLAGKSIRSVNGRHVQSSLPFGRNIETPGDCPSDRGSAGSQGAFNNLSTLDFRIDVYDFCTIFIVSLVSVKVKLSILVSIVLRERIYLPKR